MHGMNEAGVDRLERVRLSALPCAVIDIETTGFSATAASIVELAVVHVDFETPERVMFNSLLKPERRIPNREIHGISNRDVRRAPTFQDVAGHFCDAIVGRVVIAHNTRFDLTFVRVALARVGVEASLLSLCTLMMQRWLDSETTSLKNALKKHKLPAAERSHKAVDDAVSAATLFRAQLQALERAGVCTLGDYFNHVDSASRGTMPLTVRQAAKVQGRGSLLPRGQSVQHQSTEHATRASSGLASGEK